MADATASAQPADQAPAWPVVQPAPDFFGAAICQPPSSFINNERLYLAAEKRAKADTSTMGAAIYHLPAPITRDGFSTQDVVFAATGVSVLRPGDAAVLAKRYGLTPETSPPPGASIAGFTRLLPDEEQGMKDLRLISVVARRGPATRGMTLLACEFVSDTASFAPFVSLASPAATAQDVTVGEITIRHAWSPATPPGLLPKSSQWDADLTGEAYLTIVNAGAADDRLTAVKIDPAIADSAKLDRYTADNGDLQSESIDEGLAAPAGQTLNLLPGGVEILLTGLKAPLRAGERVPLQLTFQKAGAVTVHVAVVDRVVDAP